MGSGRPGAWCRAVAFCFHSFGDETDVTGSYAVRVTAGTYDLAYTPPPGSGLASSTLSGVVIAANTVLDVDLGPGIAPVSGLVCTVSGTDVQLDWVNGAAKPSAEILD